MSLRNLKMAPYTIYDIFISINVPLTLKDAGGGAAARHRSGDRLPFLTGSYYGHKIS